MSKRKYTHIQELLPEIKEMIAKGKSQREIEGLLGLSGDRPIHNLLKRERRKEKKAAAGIAPRPYLLCAGSLAYHGADIMTLYIGWNPYDNAMAENFFSILKTECIYRHEPKTIREANDLTDRYIQFYNHERIQLKTGVAPLSLRLSD